MRAAAWRLYFPESSADGFKQHKVPLAFFFYSAQPNYTVDITDVLEKKAAAAAAHTSQFGQMLKSYDDKNLEERRASLARLLMASPVIEQRMAAWSRNSAVRRRTENNAVPEDATQTAEFPRHRHRDRTAIDQSRLART